MTDKNIRLARIPLKNIIVNDQKEPDLIEVLSLSDFYSSSSDNINYLPITVLESNNGCFDLVKGLEIYQALLQSEKKWVWSLIVDPLINPNWKEELGLSKSKINICNLDSKAFSSLFEYLQSTNKKLSTINIDKLLAEHANDPFRSYWHDLEILTELKCGITRAKLNILNNLLTASPDLTSLEPVSPICINSASEDEIFIQIQRLKIEPTSNKLRKLDSIALARSIASFKDRIYFSSEQHLFKAKIGISNSLWPSLKPGFTFSPSPTPEPNKSGFLLNLLSVAELRKEATRREIDFSGLKKPDLVELLSN